MASRRTSRVSRRGQANDEGTSRSSRRGKAEAEPAPEAPAPAKGRSSRRAAAAPAEEAPAPGGRRSSARMSSAGETGRSSRRNETQRSSRSSGSSRGSGGREAKQAEAKKKRMFMNIAVAAGILLVGFLIYINIPNPNLPTAERNWANAQAKFSQFKKEMEAKSDVAAEQLAAEIKEILETPLFAMGTDDPSFYKDPAFSNTMYSMDAKNMMEELNKEMEKIPGIVADKAAKRNKMIILNQIANVKNIEDLEAFKKRVNDYRRNPVDMGGDPDAKAQSRYSRHIEEINAQMKLVNEEDERRKALSEAQRKAEEEERKRIAAEEAEKKKQEALAKVNAAREEAEAKRLAQEEKDNPALAEARKVAKLSNAEITKKAKDALKEYNFKAAYAFADKLKEQEGYDLEAEKAKLKEDIKIIFNNTRKEMAQEFNDARQLSRMDRVADARKSIEAAVQKLDKLLEAVEDEEVKKELTDMKPLYDRLFDKLMN